MTESNSPGVTPGAGPDRVGEVAAGQPVAGSPPEPGERIEEMPPVTWRSIAAVVVILGVGLGSCAGLAYWGTYEMMDSEATRWVDRYKHHPRVRERLGEVDRSGFDSKEALQEANEETLTFFLEGRKARGQLRVTEFGMSVPRVELKVGEEVVVLQKGVAKSDPAHGAPPGEGHNPAAPEEAPVGVSPRE